MKKTANRLLSLILALTLALALAIPASAAELTFDLLVPYGNDATTVSAASITKMDYTTNVVNYGSTTTYTCTAPVTITSAEKNYCGLFELNTNVASHMPCEFTDNLWAVNGTHIITEPGSYILVDEPLLGAPIKMTAVLVVTEGSAAPEEPAEPVTPGLHNFKKVNTYKEGQYSDVPATHTFSENAKAGYEYSIMQGYGSSFGVGNNITRLASIIIACRLNAIYYNGSNNVEKLYSGTTQEIYLAYAKDNGILCDFDNVSQYATRAEFAAILSSALPDEALAPVNTVVDNAIPDVTTDMTYAAEIYRLYRAGILNGSDAMGTFYPDSNINRGAACAIATRMCDEALRKSVTLDKEYSAVVKETAVNVANEYALALNNLNTALKLVNSATNSMDLQNAGSYWSNASRLMWSAASLCGNYPELREIKDLLFGIASDVTIEDPAHANCASVAFWDMLFESLNGSLENMDKVAKLLLAYTE